MNGEQLEEWRNYISGDGAEGMDGSMPGMEFADIDGVPPGLSAEDMRDYAEVQQNMPGTAPAGAKSLSSREMKKRWGSIAPCGVCKACVHEMIHEVNRIKNITSSKHLDDGVDAIFDTAEGAICLGVLQAWHLTENGTVEERPFRSTLHNDDLAAAEFEQNLDPTLVFALKKLCYDFVEDHAVDLASATWKAAKSKGDKVNVSGLAEDFCGPRICKKKKEKKKKRRIDPAEEEDKKKVCRENNFFKIIYKLLMQRFHSTKKIPDLEFLNVRHKCFVKIRHPDWLIH